MRQNGPTPPEASKPAKLPPNAGVAELVRETALGLGHMLGQHVKLAQLELKAELHVMSRRACVLAGLAALVAIGYALLMAGVAIWLGGHPRVAIPLVIIGFAHMAGAGLGLVFVPLRARASHMMNNSAAAAKRSIAALRGVSVAAAPTGLDKPHGQ